MERNATTPIPYEEYLKTLPEKCQRCQSEPICYTTPDRCSLSKVKETKITVTYFVMAFVVNGSDKKEIRSEIVKDDENKAITLANEWHKEFQTFTDQIEIHIIEHVEINKEILNLSNKEKLN